MPHVNNLPIEILYLIFKKLSHEEILDCQQVCRAWYYPAHITLLNNLEFLKTSAIEKFTTSLDYNPPPSYFNAVQKIEFKNLDNKGPSFSKEVISKMFFRFPRLKEVRVMDSLTLFEGFNDEICQEFLDKCTKLDIFEVNSVNLDLVLMDNLLYKLRNLVTIMNNVGLTAEVPIKTTLELISKYSRLKEIHGIDIVLDNFEEAWPVLYQLPDLTVFGVVCTGDDQNNFAGNHTQDQIDRLSSVKELRLTLTRESHSNTIKFVTKNMAGLEYLYLNVPCYASWDDIKQQLFCTSMVNLICSLDSFMVDLMIPTRAPKCFSDFVNRLTAAIDAEPSLVLEIKDQVQQSWSSIEKHPKKARCHIFLQWGKGLDLLQTVSFWFKSTIPLTKIKCFELVIRNRRDPVYTQETETSTYDEILRTMPFLELVLLDIPEYIKTSKPADDSYTLNLVETLALRATPDTKLQTLLDRYFYTFPNLKILLLCYYCGVWDEDINGYRINLLMYSLEELFIDITPILSMIIRSTNEKSFLIVMVSVLDKNAFYQYSFEIDDLVVTFVHDKIPWWDELICRENYHLLHIDINSLERLQICWNSTGPDEETYCHNKMEDTNRLIFSIY